MEKLPNEQSGPEIQRLARDPTDEISPPTWTPGPKIPHKPPWLVRTDRGPACYPELREPETGHVPLWRNCAAPLADEILWQFRDHRIYIFWPWDYKHYMKYYPCYEWPGKYYNWHIAPSLVRAKCFYIKVYDPYMGYVYWQLEESEFWQKKEQEPWMRALTWFRYRAGPLVPREWDMIAYNVIEPGGQPNYEFLFRAWYFSCIYPGRDYAGFFQEWLEKHNLPWPPPRWGIIVP